VAEGRKAADLSRDELQARSESELEKLIMQILLRRRAAAMAAPAEEIGRQTELFKAQFETAETMQKVLAEGGVTLREMEEEIAGTVRATAWIEAEIGPVAIEEPEMRRFYDENAARYEMPEVVRASHILVLVEPKDTPDAIVAKEQKATELAARARSGEDFESLAREFSEDPTAKQNGGDLNYFARERMTPEFADAAFKMSPGDISDPVRTRFGFHIIKVADHRAARRLSFEEAREKIALSLRDGKRRESVERVLSGLRKTAAVKIHAATF